MALETVKIPDLPAMSSTPSDTDELIIRSSAGVQRIDYSVLANAIIAQMKKNTAQSLVTSTTPTSSDLLHLFDSDGNALEQITVQNFLNSVKMGLKTEQLSPRINSSYVSSANQLSGRRYGRVCIVSGDITINTSVTSNVALITNIPNPANITRVIAEYIPASGNSYSIRPLNANNSSIYNYAVSGGLANGDRLVFCAVYLADAD